MPRLRLREFQRRLRHMPRTPAGWRLKKLGDEAFGRSDWVLAAWHYRAALAGNAHMTPVWKRLARAQVEIGELDGADRSLQRAVANDPRDPEPYWQLAGIAQARGDQIGDAANRLAASERVPGNFTALLDFVDSLPTGDGRAPLLERARRAFPLLPADTPSAGRPSATLMLDMTELMVWWRSFRLPSGVQRVQLGLIAALLADPRADVAVCRFHRTGWKIVDPAAFLHLLDLSQSGDDQNQPAWRAALLRVYLSLNGGAPVRFGADTVLVSLGSHVYPEFTEALEVVKRDTGAKFVPVIYDLIPCFRPEWFPPHVAEAFPRYLDRLAEVADAYVTISASTKRDLVRLSAERGRPIDPALVTVMALDADCRGRAPAADALKRYGLSPRGYVLFVATIEPRKNHVAALKAWRALIEARGAEAVPMLVFVGHSGWNNDEVHALLGAEPRLRGRVRMLSGVADADLSAFYANARFTLYPSLYEGWGLPITESLCHGRPAVVARNSSLTEAGGDAAEYFDADDVDELAAIAGRLIADDAYLAQRERAVAERFTPRGWRELGADVERAAERARDGSDRAAPDSADLAPARPIVQRARAGTR